MKIGMISFGDLTTPQNGYALRCWMLAQKLKAEGHEVVIYQFTPETEQTVRDGITIHSISVRHERPYRSVSESLIGFGLIRELVFPVEGYLKLRARRAELLEFDEFYIEGCLLMNAFSLVKQLKKPILLDTHCLNKDVALKIRAQNKLIGTVRVALWHFIENNMLRHVDKVIAISDHDKSFIEKHYHIRPGNIEIIPHVVDPAAADTYAQAATELRQRFIKGVQSIACFVGDLGAIQNAESEKYIRNQLAPATPDIHYVLVGKNPKARQDTPNITYTGFVEAVDPYILMADFCIAPMAIGSGVKTKVLDYLKYDKPIVATPVAFEGIDPSKYTHVCDLTGFADKMKELAEAYA